MDIREFGFKASSREYRIAEQLLAGKSREEVIKFFFPRVGKYFPFIYRENIAGSRRAKPVADQYPLFLYTVARTISQMREKGFELNESYIERERWTDKSRQWISWRRNYIRELQRQLEEPNPPDTFNKPSSFVDSGEPGVFVPKPPGLDSEEDIIPPKPDDEYDEYGNLKTSWEYNDEDKIWDEIDHDPVPTISQKLDLFYKKFLQARSFVMEREMCVTAETPILCADLTWKKAKEIRSGDTVVGFDEYPDSGQGKKRKLRKAIVLQNKEQVLPCYRVVTDKTITDVSSNHRWLVLRPYPRRLRNKPVWVETTDLTPQDRILYYSDVWSNKPDDQRAADYIAAMFDAEGHRDHYRLSFSQNEGDVLSYSLDLLHRLNFKYSLKRNKDCMQVSILGGHPEIMRFVCQVDPIRLSKNTDELWVNKGIASTSQHNESYAQVRSIKYIGERKTYSVTTTTHTFIADGLFSHNSGQYLDFISTRALKDGSKAIFHGISVMEVMEAITKTWPMDSKRELATWERQWEPSASLAINWRDYPSNVENAHRFLGYVLCLAKARIPIFLVGPSGCGKSFLARDIADALELDYGEIPLTAGATPSWLIGAETMSGYKSRPFVDIYENGGVYCFEEIDAADPNMLLLVNNALANEFLTNPVTGQEIEKHHDFVAVATANTWGLGANRQFTGRERLDAATLDRLRVGRVEIDYDQSIEDNIVEFWKKEAKNKEKKNHNSIQPKVKKARKAKKKVVNYG